LLGDLDKALSDYSGLADFDEDDIAGAVFDIKDEIAKIKTYYSYLEELFMKVENKNDQESYELFLEDEEKRKLFYDYLSQYARALKLSLSSDKMDEMFSESEITDFKKKMKFYSELRKSIKIRYHEVVDFGKYEKQMQKLLDTFISSDEVNQLTKLVNIFDKSFEEEIQIVVGDNARADAILSACTATITEKKESNPAYYEKLSKRIDGIIQEYKDKRLTQEQKLQYAKDIRELLLNQKTDEDDSYPKEIRGDIHTKAFYDNLQDDIMDKALLTDTVLKIDAIFKEVAKKPDWKHNNDVKNLIDGKLDDILWQLEDNHELKFEKIDSILAIIRSIGVNNY
jgi:type I restriction enzyme R subunit